MELLLLKEDSWDVISKVKPESETEEWNKTEGKAHATIGFFANIKTFGSTA